MAAYKSKVDIVYEYILGEIANMHYRSGDRLIINQIAAACNVSHIPVREALLRLESGGYVTIQANQGAVAVGIDKHSLADIFEIKGVLEGYLARLSINFLSINDIAELHKINEQMKAAAEQGDYKAYSRLNTDFHLKICDKTPRRELKNLALDFNRKWSITKSVFEVAPERMKVSYHEHERIIQLLENRSYNEVELYVRNHKFHAAEQMIEQFV